LRERGFEDKEFEVDMFANIAKERWDYLLAISVGAQSPISAARFEK
jgi:hypothetical protein